MDDEMEFDFTGTDAQIKGPINAPLSATYAAAFYVMRCITDPSIPNTEGCKRPIRIVAPAGRVREQNTVIDGRTADRNER